jgi:hypothetical protein
MRENQQDYQGGRKICLTESVRGDSFQALCDFTYAPAKGLPQEKEDLFIIFVEMGDIHSFFKEVSGSSNRYIIITHNGDGRVIDPEKREIDVTPVRRQSNVIAWFSTNLCSPRYGLFSIPLGLENSKWFPQEKKLEKIDLYQKKERKSQSLLYLNFNQYNNLPQRKGLYDAYSKHPWATVFDGKNGKDFESYLSSLISHDFVLSPEGNGPDTHRTWESLYLGTIPIIKRHVLHQSWKNELPILWVNEWNEITESFLIEQKKRICLGNYNWNTLRISYWRAVIHGMRTSNTIQRVFSFGFKETKRVIRRHFDKDYFGRRE